MDNKTIKKLIQNYEAAELQEMILAIVGKNPSAQQALLDYCQKKGKKLKSKDYSTVIINQLQHHWDRAREIIDEFNEYGGGPEEEEEIACDELEKMTEILETEEIPWEPRRKMLEEVLDFVRMDNGGFYDMLTDVVDSMCQTKEEKVYLADLLSQGSSPYYGDWASEIYRACGEDGKYLESKKANLSYSRDYLELAGYYEVHRLHPASRTIWGMGHRPGALFHQTVIRPVSQGDSGAVLEGDGDLCEDGKGAELCPCSRRAERDSPDYEEQSVDRRMEDQVSGFSGGASQEEAAAGAVGGLSGIDYFKAPKKERDVIKWQRDEALDCQWTMVTMYSEYPSSLPG